MVRVEWRYRCWTSTLSSWASTRPRATTGTRASKPKRASAPSEMGLKFDVATILASGLRGAPPLGKPLSGRFEADNLGGLVLGHPQAPIGGGSQLILPATRGGSLLDLPPHRDAAPRVGAALPETEGSLRARHHGRRRSGCAPRGP